MQVAALHSQNGTSGRKAAMLVISSEISLNLRHNFFGSTWSINESARKLRREGYIHDVEEANYAGG
jgi:hypothetical protein